MPEIAEKDDRFINASQVGDRLGVDRGTLARWRSVGVGPRWIKWGPEKRAAVRYSVRLLKLWIEAQETGPAIHYNQKPVKKRRA